MKYFDINCVKSAYDNFQEKLTNKSWGLLCVMRQLDRTIVPGQTYAFNGKTLSEYIENLFCLSIGKTYKDNAWYIKFSSQWYDFFKQQSKAEKPNIFDAIVWAYRKESFSSILSDTDLIKKFTEDFHVELDLISSIFDTTTRSLSYDTTLYTETALKNAIFVTTTSDNITAEKKTVTASVGELSRGPFIQPLYGALENSAFFLISQVDFDKIYPFNGAKYSQSISKVLPLQQIFYGAPGTGKSNKIKEEVDNLGKIHFRTTFHPDSDYSTFVGCYKPKSHKKNMLNGNGINETQLLSSFFDSNSPKYNRMNKARYLYEALVHTKDIRDLGLDAQMVADKLNAKGFTGCAYTTEATCMYNIFDWLKEDGYIVENKITYEFTPQAFLKAYTEAWKHQTTGDPVYLIIEEINRGNCAQIFGDIFQLLDRDEQGFSRYEISPDSDIQDYIGSLGLSISGIVNSEGKDVSAEIASGEILKLPDNLYIWATMNTSDQSLFPIDSAFKRRWEWKYMPINNHKDKSYSIRIGDIKYDWWGFLIRINRVINEVTNSEDKKLGYFFAKAKDSVISAEQFVGKVLFYLWNDVFKNYGFDSPIFSKGGNLKFEFSDFFDNDGNPNTETVNQFLRKLEEIIKDDLQMEIKPGVTKNEE